MRNLKNIKHRILGFGEDSTGITATAWDPSDDSLICAFGPGEQETLLSLKRFHGNAHSPEEAISIAAWDAPSPNPELAVDQILDLHCFSDTKIIVLILAGGDIIVVREDPQPGEDVVEIVGSVDAGIASTSWSPDEELVLIATKADTILFMTRDFENTATVTLTPEDVKVSNHVSVGWGKEETQFKGRGVKTVRDPTVPEHIDQGTLNALDDEKVNISWRGDGQYVAVNSVLEAEQRRRIIRVYTRDAVLESVSEAVNGLEGALSWKPTGQLLAGIQRHNGRIDVVFFERNGLRHGEFSLRLSQSEIETVAKSVQLEWNVDSTILAISMVDRIQLWTTSNYHWYLKAETLLHPTLEGAQLMAWHTEKPLLMACADLSSLHTFEYTHDYAKGSVFPPHDLGLVAVIDGSKLKVTPLRTANVPPPMAFDEIDLPENAIDVAFNRHGSVLVVLHRASMSLYDCSYAERPAKKAKLGTSFAISYDQDTHAFTRQVAVHPDGGLYTLSDVENTRASLVTRFDANGVETARIPQQTSPIASMFPRSDCDRVYYHLEDRSICLASDASESINKEPSPTHLPSVCSKVDVWHGVQQEIAVGVTANGVLHIYTTSQQLRIPGCTSFLIAPSHLVFTTSQHLLKFVHLNDGELEIPPDAPEKDERCRNIERGARLVTVMPSAYDLVLQMPRGNLETIYPRALVLAGIRRSLLDREYKKAFLICRSHRVDMNILHDYAPERFLEDVDLFVNKIKQVEQIDLFLSSLSEEDVAAEMYKETARIAGAGHIEAEIAPPAPGQERAISKSKVNGICDAFLAALEKYSHTHLQSIITAHVCKNPPDLVAGLSLVARLRKEANEERLEQAVEHICFLGDVNQLYDTALGMYELEVALLIAQQSQKDPREYLPYLQNLQNLPSHRQRFAIDNDLKRYQKALLHLHELKEFDELTSYTTKHELYAQAIELYRHDKLRLGLLMRQYADFLVSRNRYGDAGFAYEFIGDHKAAYEAYRSVNMWREALAAAAMVPITGDDLRYLAQTMADGLEEAKDFASAAVIHKDYLHDLKAALVLYCKAYHFAEAIRQATFNNAAQMIADVIDPGLIECSASMTELLAEMKGQMHAQVPRLRELRQKKAEDPIAFLDGADGGEGDVPDNLSVAPTDASTSRGTFMTRYTNQSTATLATNATRKTSKNRRREERKRARGKKGTVYEEEYLVNSIARLIERLNTLSEDVARLVEALMRRTMRERAVAVEVAMVEVEEICRAYMGEVFEVKDHVNVAKTDGQDVAPEERRPWGGQGVLWDSISASRKASEPPILKAFQRLSLLGSTP